MSKATASWCILGAGTVGQSVINMVAKAEVAAEYGLSWHPEQVLRRDGWHKGGIDGPLTGLHPGELPDCDVLFVTLPSTPGHEPVLSLTRQQLAKGRTVITAEKGALAEHYAELTKTPSKLGYWATVGGGTRLIPKLQLDATDPGNIKELHLALNATLTYIFSEVAAGKSVKAVVAAACEHGYAEPGATDAYEVIRAEADQDVRSKVLIALGAILPEFTDVQLEVIRAFYKKPALSKPAVHKALDEAGKYRYIVSVYPEKAKEKAKRTSKGRLGGFEFEHKGWLVIAGLQRVDRANALSEFKTMSGAGAGYYIDLGPLDKSTNDGQNFVKGTGAGGDTTANAMLDNYKALRETS
jgi:homoserine dehydrogenase